MGPENLSQALTRWIEARVAGGSYAGAVAAVLDRGNVAKAVVGKLGSDVGEPLHFDSWFSLESVSKVVCTAPLVLLLSEEGVMGLDQPIATWLREFSDLGKEQITPRQILSHTSGLPDVDDITLDLASSRAAIWKAVLQLKPMHRPGSKVRYSDLAYLILGKAIETATGTPLDRLATERLWLPLGMKSTLFCPPPSRRDKCTSNRKIRGECVDPLDRALGGVVGCDGVFSTAEDLLIFSKMLLCRSFLKTESFGAWLEEQAPDGGAITSDFDYLFSARKALGWELPGKYSHGGTLLSERAFGKVGGTGTFLWIDPARDLAAIYLTNYGQPIPFSAENWSSLIHNVGAKEFFDFVVSATSR